MLVHDDQSKAIVQLEYIFQLTGKSMDFIFPKKKVTLGFFSLTYLLEPLQT